MPLNELLQFLAQFFTTANYPPDEQGGIFYAPDPALISHSVRRLGLALEPTPGLPDWLSENRIDTLWLHRPWNLDRAFFPTNVAVLYHHLPFDEHLTIGYNRRLASSLGLILADTNAQNTIGYKQAPGFPNRPIGLIGHGPKLDFAGWCNRIADQFGGYDEARSGQESQPERIVVVGAMNDALIREAADRGAGLYVTGQYRKAARKAVDETGMAVIAVGHRRSEEWGLRELAEVLKQQKMEVEIRLV